MFASAVMITVRITLNSQEFIIIMITTCGTNIGTRIAVAILASPAIAITASTNTTKASGNFATDLCCIVYIYIYVEVI